MALVGPTAGHDGQHAQVTTAWWSGSSTAVLEIQATVRSTIHLREQNKEDRWFTSSLWHLRSRTTSAKAG